MLLHMKFIELEVLIILPLNYPVFLLVNVRTQDVSDIAANQATIMLHTLHLLFFAFSSGHCTPRSLQEGLLLLLFTEGLYYQEFRGEGAWLADIPLYSFLITAPVNG